MKIKDILKIDKNDMVSIITQTVIKVRDQITKHYAQRGQKVPLNFEGECNRACLMFDIYFCDYLRYLVGIALIDSLFKEDGSVTYHTVNMPNINYLSNCDVLKELDITIDFIHGEQKHSKKIKEEDWYIEHTWLAIHWKHTTIYCDPTSGQFQNLYPDIPDYYISTRKPKWFYPDSENPEWNKNLSN